MLLLDFQYIFHSDAESRVSWSISMFTFLDLFLFLIYVFIYTQCIKEIFKNTYIKQGWQERGEKTLKLISWIKQWQKKYCSNSSSLPHNKNKQINK